MSLKILIVDDENSACKLLSEKLLSIQKNFDVHYETQATKAIEKIKSWKPNILFLDIQMPDLDGFELLNSIPEEERHFSLIFCTAYSEYALKAFEEAAVDYLLKPVDPVRLKESLLRLNSLPTKSQVALIENRYLSKLYLKLFQESFILDLSAVDYIYSDSHETIVVANRQEYFCDLSLNSLEEKLDPEAFFRVHRSSIIPLAKVSSYNSKLSQVQLSCGKSLSVSKRNRSRFLKAFKSR